MKSINTSTKFGIVAGLALTLIIAACPQSEARGFGGYHPRRNEVLGRDRGLSRQMNRHYGSLGGHYGQLQREDTGIRHQEQNWYKQNGGYLTKGETRQLNHEENGLQRQVRNDERLGAPKPSQFAENHPRRAEVLGRDNRINGRLNQDYGHLGGNYGSLEQQDHSIRQQEQSDARANGGYITQQQRQQFNQEENQLNQQIKQDYQP